MSVQITPAVIEQMIADCELKGDWELAEKIKLLRDKVLYLEAQNQAYRHALGQGVSINLVAKKRWFKN